jgi:hypothetical protein
MEPTTLAIAATAIVATKVLEKTGEKFGDKLIEKSGTLVNLLRNKFPNAARTIETVEQPENIESVTQELNKAAKEPEVAQAIKELAIAAQADSNPQLTLALNKVTNTINNSQPLIQNITKLSEEIKFLNQGSVHIDTMYL